MATFVNPIALTKATDTQSFFNIVDFGVGLGYKFANGFMIMGTLEWFSARQPRKWFIDEYKGNDKAYIVNGDEQVSIDKDDNDIFTNKIVNTIGFKFCYTFDIVKNFRSLSSSEVSGSGSQGGDTNTQNNGNNRQQGADGNQQTDPPVEDNNGQ